MAEKHLCGRYEEDVAAFAALVRETESFDLVRRRLVPAGGELTLFYIDGLIKDDTMQKLMQYFLEQGELTDSARAYADRLPYVETDVSGDVDFLSLLLLSGAAILFGTSFGDSAVILDARTYPARQTAEPDNDRVMAGSHDGFVETLLFNTALIRRRIRDPRLTMRYVGIGGTARTDAVLCFLEGKADAKYVAYLEEKLRSLAPESLTLGAQSLAECLIRRKWYNPFPKIRRLERPDAAAAEIAEGRVLLLCDTSPQVMVLPTSVFDFLQETDDYYFPPLTGGYLRLLRLFIFCFSPFVTPLWYLALSAGDALPASLAFLVPEEPGALPILLQLYLAEIAIDGLKLASMNAPSMLTNSLSVIGGLILGDFAVSIGWFCPDVIFYMAVVAVAGFTQRSHELSYAFKFFRMALLALTAWLGGWGLAIGAVGMLVLAAANGTVNGGRNYLWPLVPFRGKALFRVIFRTRKPDVAPAAPASRGKSASGQK